MSTQEQIFPLVKFWGTLFSKYRDHESINQQALQLFVKEFNASDKSKIYCMQNVNQFLISHSILDDIFDVNMAQHLGMMDAQLIK